jgi:signal transduction histidine kinase
VRNSIQSITAYGPEKKQLALRLCRTQDRVRFVVIDNGVGIAAENLARIFSHGFTTKKDGHGFGLHSCILMARGLGGSLTAKSEGPGKGATFTLELPIQAPDSTLAAQAADSGR